MKEFFRRYAWLYLPGLLFLIASAYLQALIPKLLGDIIDSINLVQIPTTDELIVMTGNGLLTLLLTAVGVFVARFFWRYFIFGNSRRLESCLRQDLFDHLLLLPPQFYLQQKTGNLMAYAVNDIGAIRQTFGPGLAMTANAIMLGFLSINNMVVEVDARLTMLALAPVPLALFFILLLGSRIRRRFKRVQEAFSAVSDRIQESIEGILVIKAHSQENEEGQRFEKLNCESRDAQVRMTAVSAAARPVVVMLFGISFTIGLIYGSQLVLDGRISLGSFVAFQGYLALIVAPVQQVARIINVLQRGNASWQRYRQILDEKPAVCDEEDVLAASELPAQSNGKLSVREMSFIYPGQIKPALENLSFELEPGRRIGILGHTGSGKSTLANLLIRLYDPPHGSIFLDGQDIRRLPLQWLRKQFAVVPQDNFLFSATLADNIRFFDSSISQSDLEAASRLADLHDTVCAFPDGYETLVGERGITLSGGQKQRIGLARALLRPAPILIIDDTLSAVDIHTEQRIMAALDTILPDQACLIIANRVSTLQKCDEILVLENGRLTARGTHTQLMAQEGFYKTVAARQAADGGAS